MKSLSIYIHWPFCISKCPYCDFFSVQADDRIKKFEDCLLADLINSLEFLEKNNYGSFVIPSIFFGGGTPSLMSFKIVRKIISYLNKNFKFAENIEISLEANPLTFDRSRLLAFKDAGVNRLSVGIQSFLDKNLEFLGRAYRSNEAHAAALLASEVFKNVNFDFMFGYITQTFENFKTDLEFALKYSPKHISCYELTYEPSTPFFEKLQNGEIKDISESKKIELFEFAEKFLLEYDFKKYEISNFSKPHFECLHNLQYWRYNDYLGIGPASHSRISFCQKKISIEKSRSINNWIQDFKIETLTPEDEIDEVLIVGLRLQEGIDILKLSKIFKTSILEKIFSKEKIRFLIQQNLISQKSAQNHIIKLTSKGRLYLNSIIATLSN